MEEKQEVKEKLNKKPDRNVWIAAVFVLFILYVPVATLVKDAFVKEDVPSGEIESVQTQLTWFEELQGELTDFTKKMVFRKDLIEFNTTLTLTMTGGSYLESTQVLIGKEDWLFYKTEIDGLPMRDYMGTNCYMLQQLGETAQNLVRIRDYMEQELGIRFVVMVCPNKEQVYSEYMPDTVVQINEESKADQIVAYLQGNTDLTCVYPLQALLDAKDEFELYYKTDTHWNQIGSFVGMQAMFEQVYGYSVTPDMVRFSHYADDFSGDLANIAGLIEEYAIDNEYAFDKSSTDPAQHRDETILLIGDSFSDFLKVIAEGYYTEVYAVRTAEFTMEMLKEYQPDIVVWESVERYMDVFHDQCLLDR